MQIRFNYETKYGTFSDALNLPDNHSFTDAEIETMKEQRRDNWVAHIDNSQTLTGAIDETPPDTITE